MFTPLVFAAVSGMLVPAGLQAPSWHTNYGLARKLGREEGKPLAVFIGSGKAGWHQLSQEGKLGKDTERILAENYVCVYVNRDRSEGRRLAEVFGVAEGPGLVISDFSGSLQAFRHEGDLPGDDLADYLERYADPDRVVRVTETNQGEPAEEVRDRTFPGPAAPSPAEAVRYGALPAPPVYAAPRMFFPSYMGGGGRSC